MGDGGGGCVESQAKDSLTQRADEWREDARPRRDASGREGYTCRELVCLARTGWPQWPNGWTLPKFF